MNKRNVELQHHLASGCCMWSGIEDVYVSRIKHEVPEAFLFALASYGEAVYVKTGDAKNPIRFSVADGRTQKTYDRIKDVLGLKYKVSMGASFKYAFQSIKSEINQGNPVVLGPLDMYHLPYLKMYHKFHIPIHYIVMVGYNDLKEVIYVYDCDREDLQEIMYSDLKKAWQIEKTSLGDKNGFVRFSLPQDPLSEFELAKLCLKSKAERQLAGKPKILGVSSYYVFAEDLLTLEQKYSRKEIKNILSLMVEFFGTVPKLPNKLMGISSKDTIKYHANFDRLGGVLLSLGNKYNQDNWINAGSVFVECGFIIEQIVSNVIMYCIDNEDTLPQMSDLFVQLGDLNQKAYRFILDKNKRKGE